MAKLNAIQRLFGNENNELRQPDREDNWPQAMAAASAAAAPPPAQDTPPQPVVVVGLPKPRDPALRQSVPINLANAAPAGGLKIPVRSNCLLYADSTNPTDRLSIIYADTEGDVTSQPARVMIPSRLRRERYFNFIYVSWTVVPGATAILEIYDDPDGALYIQD